MHNQSETKLVLLVNIMKQAGCEITTSGEITAIGKTKTKYNIIHSAVWVEPYEDNAVFVNDAYIKYAKS